MKQYEVKITAYIEDIVLIDAEDEDEACQLAETEWADTYIVYDPDQKEYLSFTSIIAYEPEEV
jgi:hypothetical protein